MYHVDIMQGGSILYKEGDKVALDGTSWKGTVVKVESDDNICVELDNGITMFARPELLHLCTKENTKPLHDENGKFTIGHPKVGGVKKGYRTVRHYRNKLMEQLAPFIESMGEIIEAIDDPSDKVLAVSRIIKYAMPSLSSVDFKENAKRDLSAEQKIAQLNARYRNLPDPTADEEGEEGHED